MEVRSVLLIAAIAVGIAGCSDGDEGSSAANAATSAVATSAATSTTTTASTTTTSTSTTQPVLPRALGSATTSADETTTSTPTEPTDPTTDQPDAPGETSLTQLGAGDCIDAPGLRALDVSQLTAAAVVACDHAHDAEVYAKVSLNDDPDAEHPGDEHVVAAADQVCFERFEPYVGRRYVDARLEIVHLRPTLASWQRGDRSVVCLLINASGEPLAGSMAAAE